MSGANWLEAEATGDEPLYRRRPLKQDDEMDITPMIDCTFLLLIFFLVCASIAPDAGIELPLARHGTAVGEESATIISILDAGPDSPATVAMGQGSAAQALPEDPNAMAAEVTAAVEKALGDGKANVLIKASKGCRHGDVSRVAEAVTAVAGVKLHMGIEESAE